MASNYRGLEIISTGAKFLGLLAVGLAVLGALLIFFGPYLAHTATATSIAAAVTLALTTFLSGVGSGIVLYAVGDLIRLLINVADFSEQTAENSERMADALEKAIAPPGK